MSRGTLSVQNSLTSPLGRLADSGRGLIPSVTHIRALARTVGWFRRAAKLIQPEHLLLALLAAIAFGERSARAIALELGICSDINVSRQAVWKRLRLPGAVRFMQALCQQVLQRSLADPALLALSDSLKKQLASPIRRVLLGDATTFTLHPSLAAIFPGSKNGKPVPKSHLKLQLVTDLLSGRWIHFSLDPYGRSDAKAAMDILPLLRAGDLLIRDLGYACMASFHGIIAAKAFFISRLKARVHVLDETGERIPLRQTLRRLAPNQGDLVRLPVLMTGSDRVPCFLVAQRVPQTVADERRRKLRAKHKKQGFKPPGKRYLELQDWTILVTNLEEKQVANPQVLGWYRMRWRIETIFKACKSHTGMLRVAGHKTNAHHAKALVLTWVLAMILLAHRGSFAMVNLRRIQGDVGGGGEPPREMRCHRTSIFKMTERLMRSLGMEIEFAGAGFNFEEHYRRTHHYCLIHNQTELAKNRQSLAEILHSSLLIQS